MAILLRKNFASSTLNSSVTTGDTTISLTPGSAVNFPVAATGVSYFWATLRTGDFSKKEVVKVTNVSGDVFTITRAQQGTLANTFSASDIVEHNITADEVPNQDLSTTSNPTFNSLILDDTPAGIPTTPAAGTTWVDSSVRSLSYSDGTHKISMGVERCFFAKNNVGSSITPGQVVYVQGAATGDINVGLANANNITTSEGILGVAEKTIANGAIGKFVSFGKVIDVDTSAFSLGDSVYLSATVVGALTATKPSTRVVRVGTVLSVGATGSLFVSVENSAQAGEQISGLRTDIESGAVSAGTVELIGVGQRITGEFSNATVTDRAMFQTNVTNGQSAVGVLPNGTGNASGWQAYLSSTPTNSSRVQLAITTGEAKLVSDITGSGTYLPLKVYANNTVQSTYSIDNSLSLRSAGASGKNFGSVPEKVTEQRQYNVFPVANTGFVFAGNSYTDGTNWKAAQTGAAAYFVVNSGGTGAFNWTSMASVAADANQTPVTTLALDVAGNLVATGNVTAYSDARLKKDLTQISGALNKVKQLAGYTYTRIDNNERNVGLIAQDVQLVLPEAVMEDQDGKLSLAYGNMVALLVEAIKELDDKIESIKTKVY